jgi:hypothetical protein
MVREGWAPSGRRRRVRRSTTRRPASAGLGRSTRWDCRIALASTSAGS